MFLKLALTNACNYTGFICGVFRGRNQHDEELPDPLCDSAIFKRPHYIDGKMIPALDRRRVQIILRLLGTTSLFCGNASQCTDSLWSGDLA